MKRFFFFLAVLRKAADTVRARNDCNLVDWRIVRRKCAHKCVSCFVEGDEAAFFFVFAPRLFVLRVV